MRGGSLVAAAGDRRAPPRPAGRRPRSSGARPGRRPARSARCLRASRVRGMAAAAPGGLSAKPDDLAGGSLGPSKAASAGGRGRHARLDPRSGEAVAPRTSVTGDGPGSRVRLERRARGAGRRRRWCAGDVAQEEHAACLAAAGGRGRAHAAGAGDGHVRRRARALDRENDPGARRAGRTRRDRRSCAAACRAPGLAAQRGDRAPRRNVALRSSGRAARGGPATRANAEDLRVLHRAENFTGTQAATPTFNTSPSPGTGAHQPRPGLSLVHEVRRLHGALHGGEQADVGPDRRAPRRRGEVWTSGRRASAKGGVAGGGADLRAPGGGPARMACRP